jgi:hypothetical protein
MTGSAKQSIVLNKEEWIASSQVLLAMTTETQSRILAARVALLRNARLQKEVGV